MEKEEANNTASTQREALINSFCEITSSSSKSEALFFLESHNFNLDSAVSTFLENNNTAAVDGDNSGRPLSPSDSQQSYSPSHSENDSSSRSPSPRPSKRRRKRTSSNAYNLRSSRPRRAPAGSGSDSDEYYTGGGKRPRRVASAASVGCGAGSRSGGIHTFADLNQRPSTESGSDSEYEPQEYYTGGEKRILVQDTSKANDVDAIFNQAKRCAAVEEPFEHLPSSGSRSFTGTARRLTGEAVSSVPQPPENVSHTINFWSNGFTVDDGPLRRFDDLENASLLESIRKLECPTELEPADTKTSVRVILTRKEENFRVPGKRLGPFQGVGRTLGSTSNATSVESTIAVLSIAAAPASSVGPVVDQTQPSTSIQIRLGDGTRMVSQFNYQHTIRDIRGFIDASRPSGPRSYQLQTVGFPPKELAELDQTIEQAGLASSVVIQKL